MHLKTRNPKKEDGVGKKTQLKMSTWKVLKATAGLEKRESKKQGGKAKV